MDVNIETYRIRIGNFNNSKRTPCRYDKPSYIRKQVCKSRRNGIKFRRLIPCMFSFISLISKLDLPDISPDLTDSEKTSQFRGCLAHSTPLVSFIVFGGQQNVHYCPTNHLSIHDILAVHSAATLQGVHALHQEGGFIAAVYILQHSILSDSNFYAR